MLNLLLFDIIGTRKVFLRETLFEKEILISIFIMQFIDL